MCVIVCVGDVLNHTQQLAENTVGLLRLKNKNAADLRVELMNHIKH